MNTSGIACHLLPKVPYTQQLTRLHTTHGVMHPTIHSGWHVVVVMIIYASRYHQGQREWRICGVGKRVEGYQAKEGIIRLIIMT